jgi:hypothetical protein
MINQSWVMMLSVQGGSISVAAEAATDLSRIAEVSG